MDPLCSGRLRPWVRLVCGAQVLLGQPDPHLSSQDWASLLWHFCHRKNPGPLKRHLTALRTPNTQDQPWLAWNGAATAARGELPKDPAAAALASGAWHRRSHAKSPWVQRAALRRWPLGLLWEMARAECWFPLENPAQQPPAYVRELAHLAGVWYGPRFGATVWNSLALSADDQDRRDRWHLAWTHPSACIRPPAGASLERVSAILTRCRPDHAVHWPLLFQQDHLPCWLEDLWAQPVSTATLLRLTTTQPDEAWYVLEEAPQQINEFVRWQPFAPLLPSGYGDLFRHPKNLTQRLQLLATLGQLDADEPSPLLVALDAPHVHQAHAAWLGHADESEELRDAARALQVCTDKLRRLVHLRALSGHSRSYPKPVRGFLGQHQARARELAFLQSRGSEPVRVQRLQAPRSTEELDIRQLLRVQQALEGSLREASAQAWRRLLRQAAERMFAEFLDIELIEADQLPAAWLLANPHTNPDLLREILLPIPTAQRSANHAWKAPPQLHLPAWLAPIRRPLGPDLWLESATPQQTLLMGSDFHTCLSLKDGCNSHSVLINALDVNKKVLYVRNGRGRPLYRLLLAVNQQGQLVVYPVYGDPPEATRLTLMQHVADYARQCGLTLADEEGDVVQLHPQKNHYSDTPQRITEILPSFDDEDDFCRFPTRQDPTSSWLVARSFHALQRDQGPTEVYYEAATWLALAGSTSWLDAKKGRIGACYVDNLDYAADPAPLARHLLRTRPGPEYNAFPVALVALPFGELVRVLSSMVKGALWPGPGMAHQGAVLLHLSWRRASDIKALWHHLRHDRHLQPILWWLVSWLDDVPQLRCLMRSERQAKNQPGSFALAAAAHGCLTQYLRRLLQTNGSHVYAAAALARSPHPADREFARAHLHEPLILTPMQRHLAEQQPATSLGPVPDWPHLSKWAGDDDWRWELLARLHIDGALPDFRTDRLLTRLRTVCHCSTATLDLSLECGREAPPLSLEMMIKLLERPRSREQTWQSLAQLSDSDYFDVVVKAVRLSHPDDWLRLSQRVPDPAKVTAEQRDNAAEVARTSRRLQAWLTPA